MVLIQLLLPTGGAADADGLAPLAQTPGGALRQIATVLKGIVARSERLSFQASRGSRTAKRR